MTEEDKTVHVRQPVKSLDGKAFYSFSAKTLCGAPAGCYDIKMRNAEKVENEGPGIGFVLCTECFEELKKREGAA